MCPYYRWTVVIFLNLYLVSILTTRVVWFYTKFVCSIAIFNQVYYSNPNLNYFTTEMMKILLLCY